MEFYELAASQLAKRQEHEAHIVDASILVFDPGHTTGWATFHGTVLTNSGQIDTDEIGKVITNAGPLFQTYAPKIVVMEDYRVYSWKQKQHVGSEMLTTRVIGALEILAIQSLVPTMKKQPASVAKGFCTDDKLKEWGYYKPGERHARDAIRHGCYYILFGGK